MIGEKSTLCNERSGFWLTLVCTEKSIFCCFQVGKLFNNTGQNNGRKDSLKRAYQKHQISKWHFCNTISSNLRFVIFFSRSTHILAQTILPTLKDYNRQLITNNVKKKHSIYQQHGIMKKVFPFWKSNLIRFFFAIYESTPSRFCTSLQASWQIKSTKW